MFAVSCSPASHFCSDCPGFSHFSAAYFAAISMLTCLILLMAAHVAGAFPFSNLRHLFFIVPVVTPVVCAGFGRAVSQGHAGPISREPALVVGSTWRDCLHLRRRRDRCREGTSLGGDIAATGSTFEMSRPWRRFWRILLPKLRCRCSQADIICVRSSSRRSFMDQKTRFRDLQKYLIWASDALKGLPED